MDPDKPLSSKKDGSLHGSSILLPLMRISRVQLAVLTFWIFICIKLIRDSVAMVDPKLQDAFVYEAFMYYNPIYMISLMLTLWGVNLYGLSGSRVSYSKVFDLDHNHLTHNQIWKVAMGLVMTTMTSMAAYLYFFAHGAVKLAAWQPVILYCALPLILALPFDVLHQSSRFYFLSTLFRLTFPLQPISFADFFVADVLTSMAKVISDIERSVCRMSHNQVATVNFLEPTDVCGSHSLMIPIILAYPYICRFFQCLRQYSDTKEKSALFNALKYATAFPVIILSATKYHVEVTQWRSTYRPLWILSGMVNTCYSFYWDISRDWDFGCFSGNCFGRNPLLRPNLYYSPRWVYYWLIFSNLMLRISWTYKLSAHLRNNVYTVFIVAALEMFRRFQWVFFRVENEWNKMTMRGVSLSPAGILSLNLSDGDLDKDHDREETKELLG